MQTYNLVLSYEHNWPLHNCLDNMVKYHIDTSFGWYGQTTYMLNCEIVQQLIWWNGEISAMGIWWNVKI